MKQPDITTALKDAGLQVTAQRLAIYRTLVFSPHATAEEILDKVRAEIGTISKQSVYDTLNIMSEKGLIRRIQPAGSAALYEHRLDNHHHLVCRKCNDTHDIDCAVGKAPCLEAEKDHGFIIDEAEVIYWGLCPNCQ